MHLFCSKKRCFLVLTIVSAILVAVSVALIVKIFPDIINSEIDRNVRLEEDTEQFDRFVTLPFPLDFKIYVFTIANPGEVATGNKPIVKEIGPYVYKQYRNKTIHFTNASDDTISYTQMETFEFDRKSSVASENDYIEIINAPLLIILQFMESLMLPLDFCVKKMFAPELLTLTINVKVRDLLFDGITFCDNPGLVCGAVCIAALELVKKNVHQLPGEKNLRFSLFSYKVRENDGLYTVKRGIDDITTLGHIIKLDNLTHTNIWKPNTNSTCDEVKGTDATLYPPRVTKEDVFEIYSTDICRYVEIRFSKEAIYKDINGYLFPATKDTLRSKIPENITEDCFCASKTSNINNQPSCYLDGVIDLFPCIGLPILLSFPHFLWADDFYVNNVGGLKPLEDLHKTYLTIEPNTGTPLEGVKRIQINLVLRPVGDNQIFKDVKGSILPLVWLEEGVQLNDEYIGKLNDLYFNQLRLVNTVEYSLISISVLATLVFGALTIYFYCRK